MRTRLGKGAEWQALQYYILFELIINNLKKMDIHVLYCLKTLREFEIVILKKYMNTRRALTSLT